MWEGWAGEVMGDRGVRDWGRVGRVGKRIGEVKGLEGSAGGCFWGGFGGAYGQLSRDISASESTIVFAVGQERFVG